jgi:hypothetical protein
MSEGFRWRNMCIGIAKPLHVDRSIAWLRWAVIPLSGNDRPIFILDRISPTAGELFDDNIGKLGKFAGDVPLTNKSGYNVLGVLLRRPFIEDGANSL